MQPLTNDVEQVSAAQWMTWRNEHNAGMAAIGLA